MKSKLIPITASCVLILAILACNIPGGGAGNQPDLVATITAQAQQLQGANGSPASANTPQAQATLPPNAPPVDTPQPAAPAKPKNFKADGAAASITFSWNDNSLNEAGFRIYQDGVAAPIASLDAHPATGGMSYILSGLACGFKGKFSVRAFSNDGESASSNSVDGVTIPCAPTNLVLNGQGNAISFDWAVAKAHNEDGFHIYQQGVSAPVASRGPNKGSGGTIYDLTGLLCNLVATYYVTAYNSAGESQPSNLAQSETVPCGPSGLHMTNSSTILVEYAFTDNATSETGFHVYQDDSILLATLPAHANTGTISSAFTETCGENHVYSVKAFNYAGESTTSEHVGMGTQACP